LPTPADPELAAHAGYNARESWRMFEIMAEFVSATERLGGIRPAVSLFGSARTPTDHPYYLLTERIARQLPMPDFRSFQAVVRASWRPPTRARFMANHPAWG
jgi:hypothetical protein